MRYIDPSHKVLHHLDHIVAMRDGVKKPPVNVEVDLTNRCSLGCEWCHFAHTHTRGPLAGKVERPFNAVSGGDVMESEFALKLVDQLHDSGVQSITWTGGGEPTLHPDFDDIIVYTGQRMAQGIYTNGAHISPIRAALMKKYMSWVYVSFDECTPAAYKKSKGVDKFWQVIDGVRFLVDAKGDATIGVGFMLHQDNYNKVIDMRDLALTELAADYVQFRPSIRYEQEAPDEFIDNADWLNKAIEHMGYMVEDERVYVDLDRFRLYRDWIWHGYNTCHFSGLQTVITPNGKMWACVNKREHPAALLGDLNEKSFMDIWGHTKPCNVDSDCRLMCRGHMANLTLEAIMKTPPHREFV